MRVSLAVFGVFHHFELAHQLRQHGYLQTVYSTFPWFRLQREGLPHEHVETFPWYHTLVAGLARYGMYPSPWTETTDWLNGLAFDAWIKHKHGMKDCDALIAISGAALDAGRTLQLRGGKYICDRGSTHAYFQERIVREEFHNWGQAVRTHNPRDMEREEQQYAVADCITVPSQFAARSFVTEGLPAEKIRVIPYGVRLDNFHPQGELDPEQFNVIFAGQISLRKGVPYLLEAFARLRHPRKRLRMVGALQPEMRALLPKLPLDQVELIGVVPRSQLASYLSTSDVLVLPSIEEGLALVQGEAMACGCPVIATPNSGSEDLFTNGKEGFIVPIRDANGIADRLQLLADDFQLRQQMRAAA
ncbi:MAG TPA: glycosyltransferase, partial [Acidobacteriaceae bacterium]|nr:glycosyltransferase [Acidobacteriaceae bacterium]